MFIVFLTLLFVRPFISSLAYPALDWLYVIFFILIILLSFLRLKKIEEPFSGIKAPFLLFVFSLFASIIFSANKLRSAVEFYPYILALLVFSYCALCEERKKEIILKVILSSAFLISMLAIHQYFFGFKNISTYASEKGINSQFVQDYLSMKRPFLPFVTPNALGGYLAMALPLSLTSKKRMFGLLVLGAALTLTRSLGAFFGLFAGVTAYLCLSGLIKRRLAVFTLIALILAIIAVFILRLTFKMEQALPFFSLKMRFGYWQEAFRLILEHPLFGRGVGNFNSLASRYAHNSYLQITSEVGLFGLLSFLWFIFTVMRSAWRQIRTNMHSRLAPYLFCAVSIFLAHNLIDFTFFLPEISLAWWALLGLVYPYPAEKK